MLIEPAPLFKVIVGNGNYMQAEGLVRSIKVDVQDHTIKLPVYLLPISSVDLILGATWLATIGLHLANYQTLQLKFYDQGRFITLNGEPDLRPSEAQPHHIRRLQHTNAIAESYTMQILNLSYPVEPLLKLPKDVEPELALLL